MNPFRYRSYYYDTDTKLYYLHSRYYDPELGRFISPDNIGYLEPESINGLNLFAYCSNNPVNYFDPNGHFIISIGAAVSALIGALFLGGTLTYIESQFHPIEKIADIIIDKINDFNSIIFDGYKINQTYTHKNFIKIISEFNETINISISFYSEHQKNKRPSSKNKHQKGQAQQKRNKGGEKGDARRPYQKWKRKHRLSYLKILNEIFNEK